jgi:alpha-beta hydrolase superfamily lysophospholipase
MKDFKVDHLGEDFFVRELQMMPDNLGTVSANLVYHPPASGASKRAVLFIHGFIDYFFQKELAYRYDAHDYHFFALDLRRCGRSIKNSDLNNYVAYLEEYFEEIDEAVRIIKSEFGIESLVLEGHSTGGLISALYVDQDKGKRIRGLVLDSPFFEFNLPPILKNFAIPMLAPLTKVFPRMKLSKGTPAKYLKSLHIDHGGEWEYNTDWKPFQNVPVFLAWIKAVKYGQELLHKGLNIKVPILLMHSDQSYRIHPNAKRPSSDVVLNVEHMKKYAPNLGEHLTMCEIKGGIHHLVLSEKPVREEAYKERFTWLHRNLF